MAVRRTPQQDQSDIRLTPHQEEQTPANSFHFYPSGGHTHAAAQQRNRGTGRRDFRRHSAAVTTIKEWIEPVLDEATGLCELSLGVAAANTLVAVDGNHVPKETVAKPLIRLLGSGHGGTFRRGRRTQLFVLGDGSLDPTS